MTTKEEVRRLALESGFDSGIDNNDIEHIGVFSDTGFKEGCFMSLTSHIEELIELAKQAERESWASCTLSFEQIESLFPDGGNVTESGITVSAQWLHDFAKNVTSVFLRRVTPL